MSDARRSSARRREAFFSYYDVAASDPGVLATLRDLLAGGKRVVQEKSDSRMVRARDVLFVRVLDLGDCAILAGCRPRLLPPREADVARRFVRKAPPVSVESAPECPRRRRRPA